MAMGRPQKPYTASWKDHSGKSVVVPGLYKCPDGRWRINATGQKFTEQDERRAVRKFMDWCSKHAPPSTVEITSKYTPDPKAIHPVTTANGVELPEAIVYTFATEPTHDIDPDLRTTYKIEESIVWPWLRELFISDPEYIAEKTGLPEIAKLRYLPMPVPSIKLDKLIEVYRQHNPSRPKAKERCIKIFKEMMKRLEADKLDDLTSEKLLIYRNDIENSKTIESAGTKQWMYGQVKSLLSFGLKAGLNADQINSALGRAKVLWTADSLPAHKPDPISRGDFHALLNAGNGSWRAWLLVGLNLCLHFEEACALKWSEIDLIAGTHASIRNKTKKDRIPRAAVLWPETIATLKALPKGPEYVFTSNHGTRYTSVNSRCNAFAELRVKAKVPDHVTFDSLRDGAYTAAVNDPAVEERFARVMAGQSSPGLQDNYVLRHPKCVAGACEAVYRVYGPFPESKPHQPQATQGI